MTTDSGLHCWKCAAALGDITLPLSRSAECKACRASLHVCKMCVFYDTKVAKACREPIADLVGDKTRANFCGYFQPNPKLGALKAAPTADARSVADALFGGAGSPDAETNAAWQKLDDLFK